MCLKSLSSWSGYDCKGSKYFCNTWSKDLYRCCPESCGIQEPFTKNDCIKHGGKGSCTYPFLVEDEICNNINGNNNQNFAVKENIV